MQQKLTDNFNQIRQVKKDLKDACASIREELDMHLETMNANTVEISEVSDALANIELKLEKLTDRVENIESMLKPEHLGFNENIELNLREQECFLMLYTNQDPINMLDMARRLGFTEEMVMTNLQNMVAKGVPVLKKLFDSVPHFFLERNFKEKQAKTGLIQISPTVSMQIFEDES